MMQSKPKYTLSDAMQDVVNSHARTIRIIKKVNSKYGYLLQWMELHQTMPKRAWKNKRHGAKKIR
jgi:hypothetical protein